MILTGKQIRGMGIMAPHVQRTVINGKSAGESACGYDIRIMIDHGEDCAEWYRGRHVLSKGDFVLATTFEHFSMPNNVVGVVHDKSTWARRGLAVQNTVIEPGWKGFLTLELSYHGDEELIVENGDPIAQVLFHRVEGHVEPYSGKYQDQEQQPVEAKEE